MRGAHLTRGKGLDRVLAILSALAILAALMVVFASPALAHHPEVTAYQTCADGATVIHYDAISWLTTGAPGSGHPDIRIEVRQNGAGPWAEVDSGTFDSENSFRFSGDIDATPYFGDSVEVRARTVGDWDNGSGGGQSWETDAILVKLDCTEGVTVTPIPQACLPNEQGSPQGGVSFDIDPASGATVSVFTSPDFTGQVGGALGDGQNLGLAPGTYHWQATPAEGFELEGPASGTFTIAPCVSSVTVTAQPCVLTGGTPLGGVDVAIEPDSGATVMIGGPGGPYELSGIGGTRQLAPGSYTWTANPAPGFELSGSRSGGFVISPCGTSVAGSVSVSFAGCVVGAPTAMGSVTVSIAPGSAATVSVTDSQSRVVATFTGSGGSQPLPAGSYAWRSTATEGYTIGGSGSGVFVIGACQDEVKGEVIVPDEVEDVEVLPFTGGETETLFAAAVLLLGTGWALVRSAKRREEG